MSTAWCVTVDQELADTQNLAPSKAIAKNLDALEAAADELGICSLYEYVSRSKEEYESLLEGLEHEQVEAQLNELDMKAFAESAEFQEMMKSFADTPGFQELVQMVKNSENMEDFVKQVLPEEAPEEEWFDPQLGVEQLSALAEHVQANSQEFTDQEQLLQDLTAARNVLSQAGRQQARFHFTVD
jgi:hypothetical protein